MEFNVIDDNDDLEVLEIINGLPRQVYNRNNYFYTFSDNEFCKRFCLTKPTVMQLLEEIEYRLEVPQVMNNSVSPINQLLVFLRFCATGTHLSVLGDFAGMHLSTVSRIIVKVATEIAALYNRYIQMPHTEQQIMETQNSFYLIDGFPRVIGAVNCTHVRIQSPGGEDGEVFRNRKGYFSLNVQVICNTNLEATNVVARWAGSSHDATIFNNSLVKSQFERMVWPNSWMLADNGYNLRPYVLTPLLHPNIAAEERYNQSYSN